MVQSHNSKEVNIEEESLNRAVEVNNALHSLRSVPGYSEYMGELKALREAINSKFSQLNASTIENLGMQTLVLQGQLGILDTIIQFTENDQPIPEIENNEAD